MDPIYGQRKKTEDKKPERQWPSGVFPELLNSLESSSFSPEKDQFGTEKLPADRRLSRILLLFMLISLIGSLFIFSACSGGETSTAERENKLIGITVAPLPEVDQPEVAALNTPAEEAKTPEASELKEDSKTAVPEYNADEPEIFLKSYLESRDLPTEILENRDFLAALRGMDKDDAIYYTLAIVQVEEQLDTVEIDREDQASSTEEKEAQAPAEEQAKAENPQTDAGQADLEDGAAAPAAQEAAAQNTGENGEQVANEGSPDGEQAEASAEPSSEVNEPSSPDTSSSAAPSQAISDDGSDYGASQAVFELTNQARAELGLGLLSYDSKLVEIATVRASEITVLFSHDRPDGSSATRMGINMGYSMTAENISKYSWAASGEEIFNGFKGSPGHWGNMINPELSRMAVVSITVNGYRYTVMYFARP